MRIVLDECVPQPLRKHLPGLDVVTAQYMGWDGLKNGQLLAAMVAANVRVLVTVDQNLPYQQNLREAGIAVVVLAGSNKLAHLVRLVPQLTRAIAAVQPGETVVIRPA